MSVDRRQFLTTLIVSGAAASVHANGVEALASPTQTEQPSRAPNSWNTGVDFRYAPHHSQATICFPDDHFKSVVGQAGDLRYGFPKALLVGMEDFNLVIEFSLAGFQDDK